MNQNLNKDQNTIFRGALDKIIESLPVGIALIRASNLTVTRVNPAAAKMVGKTAAELVGSPCCENFCASDGPCPVLELKKDVSGVETTIRTKAGGQYHVIKSVVEIELDGELHLLESFQDMSELIKAKEEKAELQERLIQAQKMEAVGTLAGGIAHEFRNILQAIQGYAEMMRMEGGIPEERASDIDEILKMSSRGAALTNQLLTFSRKFVAPFHVFNLNKLIPDCLEVLDRLIPKMITMKSALNAKATYISGDPNQIAQVLTNLAMNASDAMPDGGTLTIKTSLIDRGNAPVKFQNQLESQRYVEIMVSDTGTGMDGKTLERIYDPFFTTKGAGKGTGLGLSVAYGIIEAHEGFITCDSKPGVGTTFFIYLPAKEQGPISLSESLAGCDEAFLAGEERILLADDEESIRELTSKFLRNQGFQVLSARSGEEAVELYKRENKNIDVAIIDLGMPGMGGAKCIKKLLEINPNLKILVASGYATTSQISASKKLGAKAFVAKPYRIATLLKTIRQLIDN